MMKYTLLKDGLIVDGTGAPRRRGDVLLADGKIAEVGRAISPPECEEVVDCAGLVVAPGFIDVHSHSDKEVLQRLPYKVLQGVTTEVVGNCGFSLFPTHPNPAGVRLTGEIFDGEPESGMPSTAEYFAAANAAGILNNVAALTGHVALRIYAMGVRREAPDAEEMQLMETALVKCLESGSIGFSTGLNCMPSSFAERDELIKLCRTVKRHGGIYTTHMRDYKFKIVEAVEEALAVARAADVPLQISHMQVVGKRNWHRLAAALDAIDAARAAGVEVMMDAYPYLAGSCALTQFLPAWCQDGGSRALLERLAISSDYARIAAETDDYMSNTWDDLVICEVRTEANQIHLGKSVQRIADERGRPAPETALDLLREEEGYVYLISFNSNEDNLRRVLTHPLTSIITDGMIMEGLTHPRTFGTYPKFLGEYVREKKWMTLEEAIVKTGALAARQFGFKNRGTIAAGNWADLVVFDPAKIGTQSDYARPERDPEGIAHVIINGEFAVRDGRATGAKAGVTISRENTTR